MPEHASAVAWAALLGMVCPAACVGGEAGSPADAGLPPMPPEVFIDGPEHLALGGQAVFRVQARRKGRATPSEPVSVRTDTGKEVFAGTTGVEGAAAVRFEVSEVASEGTGEVHLVFEVGTPPSRSMTSRSVPITTAWRPMLELDHRRVLPGGRVMARLIVLHPDELRGSPGVPATIEFLTPGGVPLERVEGHTDDTGHMAAGMTLQTEAPWGRWTVRAVADETVERHFTVLPSPSGEAPVKVRPAPPPPPDRSGLDVEIRPASGMLAGGMDNPLVALVTLDGRPAPGVDVVVRHAEGGRAAATTGERGEAWMVIPVPAGGAPLVVKVRLSDRQGRLVERTSQLLRHPGGGGLVVRPAFAFAPAGQAIRVRVAGPLDGPIIVDAWRRGRLMATFSTTLVNGEGAVDAHPKKLGAGLVWFVAQTRGKATDAAWGAAPTFVPPQAALRVTAKTVRRDYAGVRKATLSVRVEDEDARPTDALLFGLLREAPDKAGRDGVPEAQAAVMRLVRRLLDYLPDRHHVGGNLHALTGEGLGGVVSGAIQAVGRFHLAALRLEDAPGPWPAARGASGGPPPSPPTAIRFAEGAPAEPDTVAAFPANVEAQGEDGATLEFPLRPQGAAIAGALVALSEGRLGIAPVALPLERPFTLSLEAPTDVTSGDSMRVPAAVTNLTEAPISVDLRLELDEWFRLTGVQVERLVVDPGQTKRAWFGLRADDVGERELRVVGKTRQGRSTVYARMRVHPNGVPHRVVRAGVLTERMTMVKFALPKVVKDVPERGHLVIDPTRDSILRRAMGSALAVRRADLAAEAAATRIAARIAAARPGAIKDKDLISDARSRLPTQLQRLLRFRRPDGGWAWWRGGAAAPEAAAIALRTLTLLKAAKVMGAPAAAEGLTPPPATQEADNRRRPAPLAALLHSREGDGGWGDLEDTDEAVAALLSVVTLTTKAVEVFIQLDGEPLKKAIFDPEGEPMRVDLPKTLSAGPHYLRIDVPELEAGLPWSLLVDTAVKWPKKASAPLGWKVRLTASKKAKRGGKASMSVQLKRTANSEAGPLGVGLSLPPGAKPRRSDLDDAMVTGILHGYELSPGHVDLFFQTGAPAAPRASVGLKMGLVMDVPGTFRSPPSNVWSVPSPGLSGHVRGPKIKVR